MLLFNIGDRARPNRVRETAFDWTLEREVLAESTREARVLACWLLEEQGWVCDAQKAHTLDQATPAHLTEQSRNSDLF